MICSSIADRGETWAIRTRLGHGTPNRIDPLLANRSTRLVNRVPDWAMARIGEWVLPGDYYMPILTSRKFVSVQKGEQAASLAIWGELR
jgi:hypothetical protein